MAGEGGEVAMVRTGPSVRILQVRFSVEWAVVPQLRHRQFLNG